MSKQDTNKDGVLSRIRNHIENVTFPKEEKRIEEDYEAYQKAKDNSYYNIREIIDGERASLLNGKKDERALKRAYNRVINSMNNDEYEEEMYIDSIEHTLDKLDKTLESLDKTDSRIKAYYEEKKALHEIRKILRNANHVFDYDDDEMVVIEEFYMRTIK